MTWLLDMDGVIWRRNDPIAGSADAIAEIRNRGEDVAFVTNNSSATPLGYVEKLARFGIRTDVDHVVTSAQSVVRLIEPGVRVLAVAGPGLLDELRRRGCEVIDTSEFQPKEMEKVQLRDIGAVVVANRPAPVSSAELSLATQAVLDGATYFVPNEDPLYPVENGFGVGTGAIGACVTFATGVQPRYAGKPRAEMAALVRERFPEVTRMVGDQLATDGKFAEELNVPYGHVRTGIAVSGRLDEGLVKPPVAHEAEDLASLVSEWP